MPSVISGDANVSAAEFGYLDGVTSALQTQIDSKLNLAGGKILQTVSTTKSDTFTTSSGLATWVDVTGLSASITPSSASNKILIFMSINVGWDANRGVYVRLVRDSTAIAIGDAASNRTRASFTTGADISFTYETRVQWNGSVVHLDSPATTSATTYKVQIVGDASDPTNVYVNRSGTDSDGSAYARTVSSITLMEVSA